MPEQLPHDQASPPDVLRPIAEEQLAQLRDAVDGFDGGRAVMDAIAMCAKHRIEMPRWLCDAYLQRYVSVTEARVATWDEAFGRPWPKGTHLRTERKKIKQRPQVHAEVWRLAAAEPTRAIDRVLFDEVGESFSMSGSTAERLYREALEDGNMNIAAWRRAQRNERGTQEIDKF